MKKIFLAAIIALLSVCCFAQTYKAVDLSDEVYSILNSAEARGLCSHLPTEKPYTEHFVLQALNEINKNLDAKKETLSNFVYENEKKTVEYFIERFTHENGLDLTKLKFRVENNSEKFKFSFEVSDYLEGTLSSGLYANKGQNSLSYEISDILKFSGDIGTNLSYGFTAYFDFIKDPLTQVGDDYYIGNWWIATDNSESKTYPTQPGSGATANEWVEYWQKKPRTIKTFRNYAYLPYSFKKNWDGSVYYVGNMNANGLEGWPFIISGCFGMEGDLRGSWFDDRLTIGFSRFRREWSGMDTNSSLVLNSNAQPFLGVDFEFRPLSWLSISGLTGALEFPNQAYINSDAWYLIDSTGRVGVQSDASPSVKDSLFFQNLFSLAKISANFKYVYADFGTSVIYPKRIEPGYSYPLVGNLLYQNNLGDYDNIGLFGDLKLSYPGIGSLWFSAYLDELNQFNTKFWEHARCMYAWQAGMKFTPNWLPFMDISFRYTKIEPFCYTHPATLYEPYSSYYIGTSYTNNGKSLGYYLEPNSDEFFLRAESKVLPELTVGFQYQLIRHGATWGSGQVEGSSIYSELVPKSADRQAKMKYFLYDGTYEWSSIVGLDCSYRIPKIPVPLQLNLGIGYIYDWFTGVDNNGVKNNSFHFIDTAEYPSMNGVVVTLGLRAFGF